MQCVCVPVPGEFFERAIDVRARLSEEPALGAVYDPPFAHFTLQMAEDYDWDGLAPALARFAASCEPFEVRTFGLLLATGKSLGVMVAPNKDRAVAEFQAAVWEVVTPFARGHVDPFYHPDVWPPHVTIKRAGSDAAALGRGIVRLAQEDFRWTIPVESIAVQHDPAKDGQTRYQRLCFRFGRPAAARSGEAVEPNATIRAVTDQREESGARTWTLELDVDGGPPLRLTLDAMAMVRLSAAAKAAYPHFTGARCHVNGERLVRVWANTPFPVMD
ncbi:MAG: 2'-5' RNA ligase family protein [Chloroflexi bacterium]|nr:2'-5' RNA ligase family protein [Chloroflexota bacterium]